MLEANLQLRSSIINGQRKPSTHRWKKSLFALFYELEPSFFYQNIFYFSVTLLLYFFVASIW